MKMKEQQGSKSEKKANREKLGGKEPHVLNLEEREGKKGKKQKKLEQQAKNKLWKIKHKSNGLEFDDDLNPRHTAYYQTQLPFLMTEWEQFTATMRQPLPATFRTSSRSHPTLQKQLVDNIQHTNLSIQQRYVEHEGRIIQGPLLRTVPALSHVSQFSQSQTQKQYTWQAQVDNRFLSQCSAVSDLHSLLVQETAQGHLVRQEVVSMLPALLLQPLAHHRVLDVCSAPGSKTEQILSLMSQSSLDENIDKNDSNDNTSSTNTNNSKRKAGFVMANDADPKRLDSLRRRFQFSPDSRLALVCADATELVSAYGHCLFDRILCDVPCSGDGTFRKCPHLYRLFRPRYSLELHGVQLRILLQALSLLAENGRCVYSTCSLNPIEDEAVVCAALTHYQNGKSNIHIRLVEQTHALLAEVAPGFKVRPGVQYWRSDVDVFCLSSDTNNATGSSYDSSTMTNNNMDVKEAAETRHRVSAAMARLSDTSTLAAPDANNIDSNGSVSIAEQLTRCVRVVPHDQDTGGFFVAVFERYNIDTSNKISSNDMNNEANSIISKKCTNHSNMIATNKDDSDSSDDDDDDSVTDGRGAMKRLGYNPKARVSVMRRLQESHLSIALNDFNYIVKNNKPNIAKPNSGNNSVCGAEGLRIITVRDGEECLQLQFVLPASQTWLPSVVYSAQNSTSKGTNNINTNISHTSINSSYHRHSSLHLAQHFPPSVASATINSIIGDNVHVSSFNRHVLDIRDILQLSLPTNLLQNVCLCVLPVRHVTAHGDNKKRVNTEVHGEVFFMQRSLAEALQTLSSNTTSLTQQQEEWRATVYNAGLRLGPLVVPKTNSSNNTSSSSTNSNNTSSSVSSVRVLVPDDVAHWVIALRQLLLSVRSLQPSLHPHLHLQLHNNNNIHQQNNSNNSNNDDYIDVDNSNVLEMHLDGPTDTTVTGLSRLLRMSTVAISAASSVANDNNVDTDISIFKDSITAAKKQQNNSAITDSLATGLLSFTIVCNHNAIIANSVDNNYSDNSVSVVITVTSVTTEERLTLQGRLSLLHWQTLQQKQCEQSERSSKMLIMKLSVGHINRSNSIINSAADVQKSNTNITGQKRRLSKAQKRQEKKKQRATNIQRTSIASAMTGTNNNIGNEDEVNSGNEDEINETKSSDENLLNQIQHQMHALLYILPLFQEGYDSINSADTLQCAFLPLCLNTY